VPQNYVVYLYIDVMESLAVKIFLCDVTHHHMSTVFMDGEQDHGLECSYNVAINKEPQM